MGSGAGSALDVSIRELASIPVAYTDIQLNQAAGTFSDQIAQSFEAVKRWAADHGYDPASHLVIGVPHVRDGQWVAYECCVQLPALADSADAIKVKQLTGGRYAVLTLGKDSATIGATIGRFFAEYVPDQQLVIDSARPNYEIYHARIMEFCVPLD